MTYPLAGLLIHKVKQAGFHRPEASHEFYLASGEAAGLSKAEFALRKDLWARCVYAYQSVSIAKGHLPDRTIDALRNYHTRLQDQSLDLRLRCQDIVVQCCIAVSDNGTQGTISDDRANAISVLVRVFDSRLQDLEAEILTRLILPSQQGLANIPTLGITENLHIQLARLNIQVFSLFIRPPACSHSTEEPIPLLYSTAVKVLDLVKRLIQTQSFPPSPHNSIVDALLMASFTILRIAKTYKNDARMEDAGNHIRSSKHLAISLSSNEHDSLSKMAIMLQDLWTHPQAYRNANGSLDVPIPFLGRLSAGLVIDAASKWFESVKSLPEHGMAIPSEHSSRGRYSL